ncbi:hypothetical protein NHX12_006982 [Muraenolepis orangiensis]|uniref:Uncharacterized protein n=1 Tax=Muraenolepis orangiensis TaxID=630683 RepID=A0A9Q0ICK6_9TELE|nr:hypothetical protein NHX12_006982 [Muraenolepis orangiensis]
MQGGGEEAGRKEAGRVEAVEAGKERRGREGRGSERWRQWRVGGREGEVEAVEGRGSGGMETVEERRGRERHAGKRVEAGMERRGRDGVEAARAEAVRAEAAREQCEGAGRSQACAELPLGGRRPQGRKATHERAESRSGSQGWGLGSVGLSVCCETLTTQAMRHK